MRQLLICARFIATVCILAAARPIHAAEVLDQQNDVNGSATADSTSSGAVELAQTFTVGVAGTLSRIEAQLSRPGFTTSGSVILTIYNTTAGTPNASLGTASLLWSAIPTTGFGYQSFDVSSSAISVHVNDVLAIGIKSDSLFFWRSTFNLNTYAGGESKFRVLNIPPGPWTSYSPSHDNGFNTYVIATPAGLPGDFNGDHNVDAADYTVWRDHLGAGDESSLSGNGDGFGGVDQGDYALWKSKFGTSGGTGSSVLSQAAISEPTIFPLLLAASVFVHPRRLRATCR